MGTMWGNDDKYIFDDSVLDMAWKLAPKDKKIAKLVKKLKGHDVNGQWRGIVLMYEAFKNHGWQPNKEMVIIESEFALANMGSTWKEPEEAKERIIRMRDHMLDPHGARARAKETVECPFCSEENKQISISFNEYPEGHSPCLHCNGTGQIRRDEIVDCVFCDEPYQEKIKWIGSLPVTNLPCQVCEGSHKITIDEILMTVDRGGF